MYTYKFERKNNFRQILKNAFLQLLIFRNINLTQGHANNLISTDFKREFTKIVLE